MTHTFQRKLKENEKVIGTFAAIFAVVMFVSLIEIFISNIQGKSRIFFQPLATVFNCLFWSLYAYCRKDWFIFIPNIFGLVLGVLTVLSIFF